MNRLAAFRVQVAHLIEVQAVIHIPPIGRAALFLYDLVRQQAFQMVGNQVLRPL